jgi:hypothetical protein
LGADSIEPGDEWPFDSLRARRVNRAILLIAGRFVPVAYRLQGIPSDAIFVQKEVSMKKLLMTVLSAALVLAAAVATAQQNQPSTRPQADPHSSTASSANVEGTVSQIDATGRSFVVRDASGTETTVYFDQTTRLVAPEGNQGATTDRSGKTSSSISSLKVGDEVIVQTTDRDGKKFAATVKVQPKKS